jgi:hypothetical protein
MSNFDYKKYLVENKLTAGSRLSENVDTLQWPDAIRNFITTNLSSDEKELYLVVKALEKTLESFKNEMGEFDPDFHYVNENEVVKERSDSKIEVAFKTSPKMLPWDAIEKAYQKSGLTGEEFFAGVEDEFRGKFKDKPVSKEAYYKFFTEQPNAGGQDDLYTMVNWINFTNPALADKLYSMI